MMSARFFLAGALGVLLAGLGSQALAQFEREGPQIPHSSGPPAVPAPAAPAPAAADKPSAPPPPAVTPDTLLLDGRSPGGVLGPGSEGVGALIRPAQPAPGPLAAASAAPGGAAAPDAAGVKPETHHPRERRRRMHRPLRHAVS